MKIIESKEKLPIDFVAQFISKGWDEVGNLKASIDGIKREFSGTEKVEKILNDFMDAYLIAIGQMEEQAGKKIDIPEVEDLKEALFELKENDEETETAKINIPEVTTEPVAEIVSSGLAGETEDYTVEVEQEGDKIEIELEPKAVEIDTPVQAPVEVAPAEVKPVNNAFEFFTDFDDPEEDEEATERIRAWQNFQNN